MSDFIESADLMLGHALRWADAAKHQAAALPDQEQALVFARLAQAYAITALANAVLAVADRDAPGQEPS